MNNVMGPAKKTQTYTNTEIPLRKRTKTQKCRYANAHLINRFHKGEKKT